MIPFVQFKVVGDRDDILRKVVSRRELLTTDIDQRIIASSMIR